MRLRMSAGSASYTPYMFANSVSPPSAGTCTAYYTVTQLDIDAGGFTNTATASANPPTGGPVGGSDSVTVSAVSSPAITIDKATAVTSVTAAGEVAWKVHQRYSDGMVSDWVGVAGSRAPAPVTTILPAK